jgi:hypothetical protein
MSDWTMMLAGVLAMATAVFHGWLGEVRVMGPVLGALRGHAGPPGSARLHWLIRLSWQAGSVAWFGGGAILAAWPWTADKRALVFLVLAGVFAFGAAGNFIILRGRHPGWVLMGAAAALACLATF